ncbi:hypothetical protein D3C76_1448540 [compost metagenome]
MTLFPFIMISPVVSPSSKSILISTPSTALPTVPILFFPGTVAADNGDVSVRP